MAPVKPKMLSVNGIELSCSDTGGEGPTVVMVMGTGSPGRVWSAHQVPALIAMGYRVVTFDNRGIAPSSECVTGFTLDDMVADTAALIEHLELKPVAAVGTSLGGRIVQELALKRPELLRCAVMLGSYGRLGHVQQAISAGERELYDKNIVLPTAYHAAITAHLNLSRHTLDNDEAVRDWLDVIEFSGQKISPGVRAQLELHVNEVNRLPAYASITTPSLVVGFADDRTIPPHLCHELAQAIPGAQYAVVERAGHFGYLEQPAIVNQLLLDFLAKY